MSRAVRSGRIASASSTEPRTNGGRDVGAAGPQRFPHTRQITVDRGDILESESLARRWFALVEQRAFDRLGDLVHPEVTLVSKIRPGLVVHGKRAFVAFVDDVIAESLYEATASAFHALDPGHIVVEGRIRWIDEERVIRDDPVIWALSFEDGLLRRFIAARTLAEAEAVLARPPSS